MVIIYNNNNYYFYVITEIKNSLISLQIDKMTVTTMVHRRNEMFWTRRRIFFWVAAKPRGLLHQRTIETRLKAPTLKDDGNNFL